MVSIPKASHFQILTPHAFHQFKMIDESKKLFVYYTPWDLDRYNILRVSQKDKEDGGRFGRSAVDQG